jgi:mannose-6-phosphate isomerase-like protein (cupin superfamily)
MGNIKSDSFIQQVEEIKLMKKFMTKPKCNNLLRAAQQRDDIYRLNVGNGERLDYTGTKRSRFGLLKFAKFDRALKSIVKKMMPTKMKHRANEVWFLRIKETEELYSWKAPARSFFSVVSVALTKCTIVVENTKYDLNPGDALKFPLNKMHSVPVSDKDQYFFVMMTIPEVDEVEPVK